MKNKLNTSVDVVSSKKYRISLGYVPFDGWYSAGTGERVAELCLQYNIHMVICAYVHQSKLLEFIPNHIVKVIDTHDVMAGRAKMLLNHHLPPFQFSCTQREEAKYLSRADVIIGITDEERDYFNSLSARQNALTISHVSAPKFINKNFNRLKRVGIIASGNFFNVSAIQQLLASISRRFSEVPFEVHLIGDLKKAVAIRRFVNPKMKVFRKPWVIMHGFVPELGEVYSHMDLMISPMLCGTGINIKTVEAMAYGMPLLATQHGARGIGTDEPMHRYKTIDELVQGLFLVNKTPQSLQRLAALSRDQYRAFYKKNNEKMAQLIDYAELNPYASHLTDHACT